MNIFHRLGDWWERRRVVRSSSFELAQKLMQEAFEARDAKIAALESAMLEASKVPTGTANELKAIRIRLDQLELFVGLKREKKPQTVEGAARIG